MYLHVGRVRLEGFSGLGVLKFYLYDDGHHLFEELKVQQLHASVRRHEILKPLKGRTIGLKADFF